jgi:hypothetical protein
MQRLRDRYEWEIKRDKQTKKKIKKVIEKERETERSKIKRDEDVFDLW